MHKRIKLVFLATKMMLLGFIIVALNHIMWNLSAKGNLKAYRIFYLTDRILENRRTEFNLAEEYYLYLYECEALQVVN